MNKVIKIAVWLVLIIWGINQSFNMISQANTVENVVGFFLLDGMDYYWNHIFLNRIVCNF